MKRKMFSQLVEESNSRDNEIRRDALIAIGASGNKRAISILLPIAKKYNSDDNELAINVLAKYVNEEEVRSHFIKTSKKDDIHLLIIATAIASFSDNVDENRELVSALKRKSIDKYVDYCVSIVLARMGKVTDDYLDIITRPEIDTKYSTLFVLKNTEERYRDARKYAFDAAKYISKNDPRYPDVFASLFNVMTDERQDDRYRRSIARSIKSSLPMKMIPSIVRSFSDNPDDPYLMSCLSSYTQDCIYPEAITSELLSIINHTNEDVQTFAKLSLAEIGSADYVDALFDGVSSGDESIVLPCLVGMMAVKTDYATEKLRHAVEYVSDQLEYPMRAALANAGDMDSIEYLTVNKEQILKEHFKYEGEGKIDLEEINPWDISALLTTKDESILQMLSECSYEGYEEHEVSFLRGLAHYEYSVVRSILRKRLQHQNRDLRIEAVKVIMSKANPEDIDMIEPLTKYRVIGHTEADDKVRCVIADGICAYDPSKASQTLLNMIKSEFVLEDKDWDVVSHCASSLATLGAAEALPVLREYADEEVEEYRYKNILVAIAKIEEQTRNIGSSQDSSSGSHRNQNEAHNISTAEQQSSVNSGGNRGSEATPRVESKDDPKKPKTREESTSTERKGGSNRTLWIVVIAVLILGSIAAVLVYYSGEDQVQTSEVSDNGLIGEVQSLIEEWNDGLREGSGYRVASCYQHKSGSVEKHAANLDRLFAKWGSIAVEASNIEIKELNPYKAEVKMQRKIEYSDRRTSSESEEHSWSRYSKYTNESLVVEKLNGQWLITYERPTNEKSSKLYYYDDYSESWWQKTGKNQFTEIISIPSNPW